MKYLYIPLLVAISLAVSAQDEWKLSKSGHGVEVYTRDTDESPIKEYRAEVVVDAPLGEVINFFNRIELHPEWMAGISSATHVGDAAQTLHYVLDAPFPMTDRYVLISHTPDESKMPDHYRIAMEGVDIPVEESKNIRLAKLKGGWSFDRVSPDQTRVIQQFISDPGGAMPDWLVNMFIVKNPYHSLKALKEIYETD